MKLRPYQEEAADFLFSNDRAMILAPVGAGKTAITLTAMEEMLHNGYAHRFLVVAPLRVAASVWPQEACKWAPKMSLAVATGTAKQRRAAFNSTASVVVTNYDSLQSMPHMDFDAVVFDELTRLKNPSGKRFKALAPLLADVNIRWGLTGSFTSNGLEDVFGQCKVIDQTLLGRSKGAFMQMYFTELRRDSHTEYTPRPGALEVVMQRISPATYLLEPGEYKDKLPPLHTVEVEAAMDMVDYDTMKKDFVLQFTDATAIAQNAAVVTQKLQQMASGFIYLPEPRWLSPHKFDALEEVLQENQRANTIVFYNYVEELAELKRRYPKIATVDDIDAWNAGKVPLMALHPKSAGHGLNLQHGGHHMIWLSLPWSLELYEQAIGRLHRSGQKHAVWNYVILTQKTIDHKMYAALADKQSLSQLALEALK